MYLMLQKQYLINKAQTINPPLSRFLDLDHNRHDMEHGGCSSAVNGSMKTDSVYLNWSRILFGDVTVSDAIRVHH